MTTTTKRPRAAQKKRAGAAGGGMTKDQLAKALRKLRHGDSCTVPTSTMRVTAISMSEAWRLGGFSDMKVVTRRNEDGTYTVTRVR